MILSCIHGQLDVVKWLLCLDKSSKIDVKDSFKNACINGHEKIAKFILDKNQSIIDLIDLGYIFLCLSENGHLNIAKWLINNKNINIYHHSDISFIKSCKNGHLKMAKWLITLLTCDYIPSNKALITSCSNGHIDIVVWLWSLDKFNKYIFRSKNAVNLAFNASCSNGHLKIAKWLYDKKIGINIHYKYESPFIYACKHGYINTVKWLYGFGIDIRAMNDFSFYRKL